MTDPRDESKYGHGHDDGLEPLEPLGAKLLVVDLGQGGHAQGLHMRVMRPMPFATNGHDWNSCE